MCGSKETPYPGCVLINFWSHSDNKRLHFFVFKNFSAFFIFANIIKIYTAQILFFDYAHWP